MAIGSTPDNFDMGIVDTARAKDMVQRILRRGRRQDDPATESAMSEASQGQALPRSQPSPVVPPSPDVDVYTGEKLIPRSTSLSEQEAGRIVMQGGTMRPPLEELFPEIAEREVAKFSSPAPALFETAAPQRWQGKGGYFYSYKPASGNRPATIDLHGGPNGQENLITITEDGQNAEAFAAIIQEARKLNANGSAGQYVTPQQYKAQRREEGIPSPVTDAQAVQQVAESMMEEQSQQPGGEEFRDLGRDQAGRQTFGTFDLGTVESEAPPPLTPPLPPSEATGEEGALTLLEEMQRRPQGARPRDVPNPRMGERPRPTLAEREDYARRVAEADERFGRSMLGDSLYESAMSLMGAGTPTLSALQRELQSALSRNSPDEVRSKVAQMVELYPEAPIVQELAASYLNQ